MLQLWGSGWANPAAPHGRSRLLAPLGKGRSCSCPQNGIRGGGTALKSPWKSYPQMQKPVAPAAVWPAVLGSVQCSLRTLLLLGFGRTPQKTPKSWFGFPKGDQTPTKVGRGGDQGAPGHGRPRHAAGAFGVSSALLPTHVSTRDALGTRLRSKKSPPKTKEMERDGCRWPLGMERPGLSRAGALHPVITRHGDF